MLETEPLQPSPHMTASEFDNWIALMESKPELFTHGVYADMRGNHCALGMLCLSLGHEVTHKPDIKGASALCLARLSSDMLAMITLINDTSKSFSPVIQWLKQNRSGVVTHKGE